MKQKKEAHYLELLASETMKLLASTKMNKMNKNESGEYVPHLQITKVVLVHCNTAKNDY